MRKLSVILSGGKNLIAASLIITKEYPEPLDEPTVIHIYVKYKAHAVRNNDFPQNGSRQ